MNATKAGTKRTPSRAKSAKATPRATAEQKIILVGTYRKKQLERWILPRGLYNYPVKETDTIILEDSPLVSEIWLYLGKTNKLCFSATLDREVSASELDALGYPKGMGRHHSERYLLFHVTPLKDEAASPDTSGVPAPHIDIRFDDFAHDKGLQAKLKERFADAHPKAPTEEEKKTYFDWLPEDLLEDWLGNLFVCEEAEQLTLWDFRDDGGPALAPRPKSAWDKEVEVEKSSYQWTGNPVFFDRTEPLRPGKPNVLELFCGCGGTSCGFEMAGYQTVMGADILEPAVETFRANHPTASVWLGDIRKISADEIARRLPGPIDVVIAGIPCQGFSLNNRKRHDGDGRNSLYLELLRILRVIRPKCVVVENVSGIQSSSNGEVVREIERGIFEACRLTVRHKLLNAAEFGVPQRRSRVVFVGVRDPKGFDFESLRKTNGPETGRPFVTVREAIGDLPRLVSGEVAFEYGDEPQTDYQRRMRGNCTELLNHIAPSHPAETVAKIAATRPGEPMYPKFRQRIRLDWDAPSPTQVSGGIRPQFQFGHPRDARGLTIRERCRIQSFPDWFEIRGGTVQGRVQTGNAVPPLLAFAVANALKPHLKRRDRP